MRTAFFLGLMALPLLPLACSSTDVHPPLLPDCPTCFQGVIYIDATLASDVTTDTVSFDAAPPMDVVVVDAPLDTTDGG